MIRRNVENKVREALADTPVVLLSGARQTGKTTLAHAIASTTGAQYFTLDDAATLALAAGDPSGSIRSLSVSLMKSRRCSICSRPSSSRWTGTGARGGSC